MRRSLFFVLAFTISSLTFPAHAGDSLKDIIQARENVWAAAFNANDAAALGAIYEEDAVLIPPGMEPVYGRPAIEDPLVRDQLVRFLIEERVIALNGKRARIPALVSERPASIPLGGKLVRSEFNRRLNQFAVSIQGGNSAYYVGDAHAIDGGLWQRGYFNAFSSTIGGGTSQIQKNILGERVLGLPKS